MDTKNSINTSPVEVGNDDEDESTSVSAELYNLFSRRFTASEKNMLAGGFAGSVGKTATAPFSRLTVLYQVSSLLQGPAASASSGGSTVSITAKDPFQVTLLKIVRREGFLSLWKGNFTSVVHRFPYSAINFAVYEKSKIVLTQHRQCTEDSLTRFLCGSIAGGVACFICYPLDIVRTRLTVSDTFGSPQQQSNQRKPVQNRFFGRMGHVMSDIFRKEGILGLYRGLSISLMVSVPTLAISFTVYGFVKESFLARNVFSEPLKHGDAAHHHRVPRLEDKYGRQLSVFGTLLCGSTSGLISSAAIFPADVVRKRMQVMGLASGSTSSTAGTAHASSSGNRFISKSTLQCCRHLYQTEGVAGFYRGIVPELLKVCPMVAITFCSYELSKDYLNRHF